MIIKTYQKSHLAQLYSPELTTKAALRKLSRWINGDRDLKSALSAIGYFEHKNDRYFTRHEVALLFEYIGDPSA